MGSDSVTMTELETFVREILELQQLNRGRFIWTVPDYAITTDLSLTVQWAQSDRSVPMFSTITPLRKKTNTPVD